MIPPDLPALLLASEYTVAVLPLALGGPAIAPGGPPKLIPKVSTGVSVTVPTFGVTTIVWVLPSLYCGEIATLNFSTGEVIEMVVLVPPAEPGTSNPKFRVTVLPPVVVGDPAPMFVPPFVPETVTPLEV